MSIVVYWLTAEGPRVEAFGDAELMTALAKLTDNDPASAVNS